LRDTFLRLLTYIRGKDRNAIVEKMPNAAIVTGFWKTTLGWKRGWHEGKRLIR
jgi:hypothetical protein